MELIITYLCRILSYFKDFNNNNSVIFGKITIIVFSFKSDLIACLLILYVHSNRKLEVVYQMAKAHSTGRVCHLVGFEIGDE